MEHPHGYTAPRRTDDGVDWEGVYREQQEYERSVKNLRPGVEWKDVWPYLVAFFLIFVAPIIYWSTR